MKIIVSWKKYNFAKKTFKNLHEYDNFFKTIDFDKQYLTLIKNNYFYSGYIFWNKIYYTRKWYRN